VPEDLASVNFLLRHRCGQLSAGQSADRAQHDRRTLSAIDRPELAGLPLDASFAEQKRILQRRKGNSMLAPAGQKRDASIGC
jgi:hypothetical protein